MKELVVFVGDTSDHLATQAKQFDSSAAFVDDRNLSDVDGGGVFYASLGDMSRQCFVQLLLQASIVYYRPPSNFRSSKLKQQTEIWLAAISRHKTIDGFTPNNHQFPLLPQRVSKEPQLWIAGCSIAAGTYLESQDTERYGQLVADSVGSNVTHLAISGSAIELQASRILRADLAPGDTILWELTSLARTEHYNSTGTPIHIGFNTFNMNKEFSDVLSVNTLLDDNRFYQTIARIDAVVNVTRKLGCHLMISQFTFLNTDEDNLKMFEYLSALEESWVMNNSNDFLDLATDAKHPGPLQHKQFAELTLAEMHKRGLQ